MDCRRTSGSNSTTGVRRAARRIACALAACCALLAAAVRADTAEHTLANGMRVIVKPDRRAPVAVMLLWYKVGSIDESSGATGLAHVVEHMMFKGTPSVPNGEYARIVSATGARFNAFTSQDYTAYYQALHKSRLPLALELEADRMTNLLLAPEEFSKEIKVVMEERRWRSDDQPRALVYEQLMATALRAHPYRNPIIGWMSDLENMEIEDVREFYRRWYAPNNALLVVVGDVAPQEVFELAQRQFGGIEPRVLPPRKPQEEPPQLGIVRLNVKAPAELPYVLMGYRVPVLRDPERDREPYALEMLAGVLDGHDAARLPGTLVRGERVATSADASYDSVSRGPGMFYLSATPTPGRTAADVEQALRRELRKIAEEGVTGDELKRVKAQVIAAQVFQRDSMFFQARQIGGLEIAGISHRTIDLQLRRLQEVTAREIQEVARKYFTDDGLTVGYLDPQPLTAKRPSAPPAGLRHAQ